MRENSNLPPIKKLDTTLSLSFSVPPYSRIHPGGRDALVAKPRSFGSPTSKRVAFAPAPGKRDRATPPSFRLWRRISRRQTTTTTTTTKKKRDHHHHHHRAKKKERVANAIADERARTISSGDSTPNCTVFTRFSSAVECGKRSKTLMMFTCDFDD